MIRPPRHVLSGAAAIVAAAMLVAVLAWRAAARPVDAAFWFEAVSYESSRLGGPLTPEDVQVIAAIASRELVRAFAPLGVVFSTRRDAMYGIAVVQTVRDPRSRRRIGVAGASRSVAGVGGRGTVNFEMLASFAVTYAPADAARRDILEAIGRGVGRAAVHEFAHVFLGSADIHDNMGRDTYEFANATRREQFYGELRWGKAWPLLQRRFSRG